MSAHDTPEPPPVAPPADGEQLLQVITLFRHGARFPTVSFPSDTNWPKNAAFWQQYRGSLTAVGSRQLYTLGKSLRAHYSATAPGFMPELATGGGQGNGANVLVFTSNTPRTLMSAQNFLSGLLPYAPVSVRSDADGVGTHYPLDYVPIQVEDQSASLFFTQGLAASYLQTKERIFAQDPFFDRCAIRDDYCSLLDKLWKMTGYHWLDPKLDNARRLQALVVVEQQIAIERAHNMHVLNNTEGPGGTRLELDEREERLIREVARYAHRLKFQGPTEATQREISAMVAGHATSQVMRFLEERAEESDTPLELVAFSAHDNTLMAVLSFLGIRDWPCPSFAAYLVFELWTVPEHTDPVVRVRYNPDPSKLAPGDLLPLPLPDIGFVQYDDLFDGRRRSDIPLADMRCMILRRGMARTQSVIESDARLISLSLLRKSSLSSRCRSSDAGTDDDDGACASAADGDEVDEILDEEEGFDL